MDQDGAGREEELAKHRGPQGPAFALLEQDDEDTDAGERHDNDEDDEADVAAVGSAVLVGLPVDIARPLDLAAFVFGAAGGDAVGARFRPRAKVVDEAVLVGVAPCDGINARAMNAGQ